MAAAEETESPPIRIRCLSHTRTKQGETPTCRFHTLSKMIIKAIFEDNLKLDNLENQRYKRCMPLETPLTAENSKKYSEQKCSKNGYIKIMLFYYFFNLAQEKDIHVNGPGIQALLAMPPLNPPILGVQEGSFKHLKPLAVKTPFFGYQVMLDVSEQLPDILKNVIIPILRLGYYLELGLVSIGTDVSVGTDDSVDLDASEEVERQPNHIVLIVGVYGKNIIIKNTWDNAENVIPFDYGVVLETERFKVLDLFFILPHDFKKYVYNHAEIEEVYGAIASITSPPSKDAVLADLESAVSVLSIAPPAGTPSEGGKKRKTKYGQRRNHHQSKAIRASRKRSKTYHPRRLFKY